MGILDVFYCPNIECDYNGTLKEGQKCSKCGATAQKFGMKEAVHLREQKRLAKQSMKDKIASPLPTPKTEEDEKGILISNEMSDENITSKIAEDMKNLKMHEKGTGIDGFLTILSGTAMERISASLLKAIVDQNKIMIRQNELILRALTKIAKAEPA